MEQTLYPKLRPGPGRPPSGVRADQLTRMHGAMVALAAERGYEGATVRALTRAAGVSSRTFYSHFANREECLASAVETIGRDLLDRAAGEGEEQGWEEDLRSSLGSLLVGLAERPKAARLLLVEVFAAGPAGRTSALRLTEDFERLLAELLEPAPAAPVPPHRLVIGIAAGVVRVATTTSLADRLEELPELAGELADWALAAYDERAVALCAPLRGRRDAERRREPDSSLAEPSAPTDLAASHGERERMLSAAAKLVITGGFATLIPSKIRREAGVSRRSFDAAFGDATECFLAAVEALASAAARQAASGTVDRTMLGLCAQAARNEPFARLVLSEVLAPGRAGLLCREHLVAEAAAHLAGSPPAEPGAPALAAEASVAAAWRIAQDEVSAGRASRLPLAAPLLSLLLTLPLVGIASG